MTSCAQLEEVEALVLDQCLDDARRSALGAHVAQCSECAAELELVTAERALFARRAEAIGPPPPALAFAVERRLEAEATPLRPLVGGRIGRLGSLGSFGRLGSIMDGLLRHGHVVAACAAALLLVASIARLGPPTASHPAWTTSDDDDDASGSGLLASFGSGASPETLACAGNDEPASCDDYGDGKWRMSSWLGRTSGFQPRQVAPGSEAASFSVNLASASASLSPLYDMDTSATDACCRVEKSDAEISKTSLSLP